MTKRLSKNGTDNVFSNDPQLIIQGFFRGWPTRWFKNGTNYVIVKIDGFIYGRKF
jgi:hypothetical protein